jgi:hypothetical protein
MTLNEAGARLESQLAPRTAAHMLPRTLPSLLLTSRPRLQVVPDLSNRRCRSPHTARLRSSDRRRGQLSFWNQDDPCVPLPTLDFDTLVDTYFLVLQWDREEGFESAEGRIRGRGRGLNGEK